MLFTLRFISIASAIPPKIKESKAVEFSIIDEECFTDEEVTIYGKPDYSDIEAG
ncbi:MAG: hypothetical protein LZF61_10915 [Nitrosomonas sp.]|nr:MAG: hypothetical protein LZF61_10915 [Nitrosomonas sp.]